MKKLLFLFVVVAAFVVTTGGAMAKKPESNKAGAQKFDWHLSGDVMPVPPYGSIDIPGSDTASKLIVNQPNGNVEVMATGVMKGLVPYTTYTVYLSKGYDPYVFTGWDVTGEYLINVEYQGHDYPEKLILNQVDEDIDGVSLDTVPPGPFFTVTGGTVVDNVVNIYAKRGSLTVHMVGTIAPDGSMSGDWSDEAPGIRSGTWETKSGTVNKKYEGNTGWPGLLEDIAPFTFMTDEDGSGSWHYNFLEAQTDFSVWINNGGTLLISDSITL